MGIRDAELAVKKMLMSGYKHYSRAEENQALQTMLRGIHTEFFGKSLSKFPLARQPLRNIKNNLICFVAVTCRYAADLGADDERCYALSDYYINEIENRVEIDNYRDFMLEISKQYIDQVCLGKNETYSLPIIRAIRYIQQSLYEPFNLSKLASAIDLHPNYLSSLFKKETGVPLSHYVRDKKMDEAIVLLCRGELTETEIAELLGYSSLSYFTKVFRSVYLCSPTTFMRSHTITND